MEDEHRRALYPTALVNGLVMLRFGELGEGASLLGEARLASYSLGTKCIASCGYLLACGMRSVLGHQS